MFLFGVERLSLSGCNIGSLFFIAAAVLSGKPERYALTAQTLRLGPAPPPRHAPAAVRTKLAKILAFPLAALALAALWSLWPAEEIAADGGEFPFVTWSETQPRVDASEWLLVDARDEEQFNARHIPRAISLPSHSYPEMLEFFAEDHGTSKTVVVYCGTEDCDLSTQLAIRLRDEIGYGDVRILEGGFLAWQREQ